MRFSLPVPLFDEPKRFRPGGLPGPEPNAEEVSEIIGDGPSEAGIEEGKGITLWRTHKQELRLANRKGSDHR